MFKITVKLLHTNSRIEKQITEEVDLINMDEWHLKLPKYFETDNVAGVFFYIDDVFQYGLFNKL